MPFVNWHHLPVMKWTFPEGTRLVANLAAILRSVEMATVEPTKIRLSGQMDRVSIASVGEIRDEKILIVTISLPIPIES